MLYYHLPCVLTLFLVADRAKTRKLSGKILRTRARNKKKATKAAKKKTTDGLPDDEDIDEDEDTDDIYEDDDGEVQSEGK
jgi:hypothetical protein